MKKRRFLSLFLSVLLIFSLLLSGCTSKSSLSEESPVTMYIGLGNNGTSYYNDLQKMISEDLGIELKYVYTSLMDTSNSVLSQIRNNDLPADIVVTASRTPEEDQKNAFCDLADISNISQKFTTTELHQFSVGSSVYQVPLSSRLIGVEYNDTLMNEMGWTVPTNFEEMIALKTLADEAGIKFAVSGGAATGHGFNYLFHLMGADYLSTMEGSEWYSKFMNGKTDVASFEKASSYFEKYAQAGLFGSIHSSSWASHPEFSRERALFYYNIINDVSSYDGFQYTHDGRIVGATYDDSGNIEVIQDADGNAVFLNDEYVYYDSSNDKMAGLQRYSIPGAVVLHDKYLSMPWLSEDGSSNLYTIYNNMYLALGKHLLNEGNEARFEKALKVIDYMTQDKATSMFSSLYLDGYVPVKDYDIKNDRMYKNYAKEVSTGYIQPWYYNDFDNDTIVNVGDLVNRYLQGDNEVDLHTIMAELDSRVKAALNKTQNSTSYIVETMDYQKSASVVAVAGTYSLSKALENADVSEKISISLVPYTTDISNIPVTSSPLGIVQSKFYEGPFYTSMVRTYINLGSNKVYAIHMTGEEIKNLIETGYDVEKDFNYDFSYPYECVLRNGGEINPDETYLVCVAPGSLTSDLLNSFMQNGKVLMVDGEPISGTAEEGLLMYAEKNDTIDSENLVWLE